MCDGKGEYAIAVLTFFRKEREVSSAGTSRFGRKQLMLYYFDGYGLQALFWNIILEKKTHENTFIAVKSLFSV